MGVPPSRKVVTVALREIRAKVLADFRRDLSRYRELASVLRRFRRQYGLIDSNGLHTSLSLKYCHLYNDLAHLVRLDELLSYQPDLFGF